MAHSNNNIFEEYYLKKLEKEFDLKLLENLLTQNGFFSYFKQLNTNDKNNLIRLIMQKKKTKVITTSETNDIFFNKIDDFLNNLENKINNNELSEDELAFIIYYFSRCIISNIDTKAELINKIAEKYIINTPKMLPQELPFLLLYLKNSILKTKFNLKFDITISTFSCIKSDDLSTILINSEYYYKLLEMNSLNKEDFYNILCYQSFALFHEINHLTQFETAEIEDDEYAKRIKKEITINELYPEFYAKYHNCFFIERESDEFGFECLKKYCNNIIPNEIIKDFIEKSKESLKVDDAAQKSFENELERLEIDFPQNKTDF